MGWRFLAHRVGAFAGWTAAGTAIGLAGGSVFGLLTALLWMLLKGDVNRGLGNGLLFALAGAAAGFILAVAAWWTRAETAEPAKPQDAPVAERLPGDRCGANRLDGSLVISADRKRA